MYFNLSKVVEVVVYFHHVNLCKKKKRKKRDTFQNTITICRSYSGSWGWITSTFRRLQYGSPDQLGCGASTTGWDAQERFSRIPLRSWNKRRLPLIMMMMMMVWLHRLFVSVSGCSRVLTFTPLLHLHRLELKSQINQADSREEADKKAKCARWWKARETKYWNMAENKTGPNLQAGAGIFAKRVQKSLSRAQEKVRQRY